MSQFQVKYSINAEIDRVKDTIKQFDWLIKNGYNPTLPNGLMQADFHDVEKIKSTTLADYKDSNYETHKEYIELHALDILPRLSEFISLDLKVPFHDSYEIHLTRYGTNGSYRLPNSILINVQRMYQFGLMRTIAHEMMHLAIESYVLKHNISHWVKERVVYLLLSKCLPKYNREASLQIDPTAVDSAFEKYYPDIEKVLIEADKAYQKS